MKPQSILVLAILVLLFGSAPTTFGTSASFRGLGDLPGGIFRSYAYGVSADGSVVVGISTSDPDWGYEPFRWENGTMTGLGYLPGGSFVGYARGVSADGSVVVGSSRSALGYEAFRWENGVMMGLGFLSGGRFYSEAYGVSADGLVVVGRSDSPLGTGTEAFRWENGVMTGLGDLPGGRFSSTAHGVSADGSVVVGMSSSTSGNEAFRWENGVMTSLGSLPSGNFDSKAFAVSANGLVVVGSCYTNGVAKKAFIWNAHDGMMSIQDLLVSDYGLDLTGWSLRRAWAISADGLTIVGFGTKPDGNTEAWVATVPTLVIEAEINIKPKTFNLKSKGKWISCEIWLPEDYNVADVNAYNVFLKDEIGAEWIWFNEQQQVVMVKFNRSEVCQMLLELDWLGDVELTVNGELADGTRFIGTDTIRVINKGRTED